MKKTISICLAVLTAVLTLLPPLNARATANEMEGFEIRDLADYVDPFIGTKGYGSSGGGTYVGPVLPFGSIYPGPDTPDGGSAGYDYTKPIRGFSQTHVSGTGGGGKYGNFLISPQTGEMKVGEKEHDSEKANETAKAYYYSVDLLKYGIKAELAPTHHAAIYRFTFPRADQAGILIDLAHYIPSDLSDSYSKGYAVAQEVFVEPEKRRMTGWGTYHGGWQADRYNIYFAAEFDRDPSGYGTWKNGELQENSSAQRIDDTHLTGDQIRNMKDEDKNRIGGYFRYKTEENEQIQVKIAISMVSIEKAEEYLKEIPGWDFEAVRDKAKEEWNKALSTILIDGAQEDEMKIFYTALFRTMAMPRNRTGDNPWGSTMPYYDDHYTIWDTFRTQFPLLTIIKESVVRDNVLSFIERYKHNLAMVRNPATVMDAFIAGAEAGSAQGGDDVDNVIADAYVKGVSGIDWEEAYQVLKYHADQARHKSYRQNDRGWIPSIMDGFPRAGVSKTLEYAYNDFCIAQVAKGLGKTDDYDRYLNRSRQWENLWDPDTTADGFSGFIRPKDAYGKWMDFDPNKWYNWDGPYFYEGSAWDYSYFVLHDIGRLVTLMGGPEKFAKRLQFAFDTGKITIWNEPSFLASRLFHYAGKPYLSSKYARSIMTRWTKYGYPGDEDAGAMSSFYIFSAIGFFPCAGQDFYFITGPMFEKVTIQMENGKKVIINGINASFSNKYVQSAQLNGEPFEESWFRHDVIKDGAEFTFVMGRNPSDWGSRSIPPSLTPVSIEADGAAETAEDAAGDSGAGGDFVQNKEHEPKSERQTENKQNKAVYWFVPVAAVSLPVLFLLLRHRRIMRE